MQFAQWFWLHCPTDYYQKNGSGNFSNAFMANLRHSENPNGIPSISPGLIRAGLARSHPKLSLLGVAVIQIARMFAMIHAAGMFVAVAILPIIPVVPVSAPENTSGGSQQGDGAN